MTQITLSRIARTALFLSAAVLVVGCSQSGTPAAAPTSSALPAASSASAPVAPVTTPPPSTPSTAAPGTAATTTGEPATTPPPAPPTGATETTGTDLTGEVYGRIVAVDPTGSTITLDKYDWFVGDAAQQACAEDGVTEHDNGWCTDYYYRNVNPTLRELPVGPDASVSTLTGGSPDEVAGDLTAVQDRLSSSSSSAVFRIVVTDGEVTSIREVYFP